MTDVRTTLEQRIWGADGGPRKPGRFSQCEKILRVLADGEPHLVSEIHERAGYSRLNSRVSELRSRGYDVQCFHVPGESGSRGYGYQLIESQLCAGEPPNVSGDVADSPISSPAQMSFEAVA